MLSLGLWLGLGLSLGLELVLGFDGFVTGNCQCILVFTHYQRVMDGQTDKLPMVKWRSSMVLHDRNEF